jgi:hypothetical protein
MIAGHLEQSLILGFEEYRRVALFPDGPFDRVGRIAKDNLTVFAKFQEAPDACKFSFPGDG